MEPNGAGNQTATEEPWAVDENHAVRQSFHYHTSKMISELPLNKDVKFSRAFLATASQLLLEEAVRMARDLKYFADHGQRSKVNIADVRLLFRSQPEVLAEIDKKNKFYKERKRGEALTVKSEAASDADVVPVASNKKPRKRKTKIPDSPPDAVIAILKNESPVQLPSEISKKSRKRKPKTGTADSPVELDAELAEHSNPSPENLSEHNSNKKKTSKGGKSKRQVIGAADGISDLLATDEEPKKILKGRQLKKPAKKDEVAADDTRDDPEVAVIEDETASKAKQKKRRNEHLEELNSEVVAKPAKKSKSGRSSKESKKISDDSEHTSSKPANKSQIKLPFNLLTDNEERWNALVPNAADRFLESPTFSQLGLSSDARRTRNSTKSSPKVVSQSRDDSVRETSPTSALLATTISVGATKPRTRRDYDKLMEGIDD